jgi:hypothetical protein
MLAVGTVAATDGAALVESLELHVPLVDWLTSGLTTAGKTRVLWPLPTFLLLGHCIRMNRIISISNKATSLRWFRQFQILSI